MIAASIAISFLGAFTSTQLFVPHKYSSIPAQLTFSRSMCQARMSLHLSSVLIWTILGSLTFGFCSIWSLHFVAMLACELDLPIGIDVSLTLLSAVLAVFFTFAALASDLLWDTYMRSRRRNYRALRRERTTSSSIKRSKMNARDHSSEGLLDPIEEEEEEGEEHEEDRDHQDAEDPQSPLFSRRLSEQDRNETFRPDTPPQTPPISPQPVLYRDPAHKMLGLHVNGSAGGTPTKLPAQSPEQITPTRVESAESSTGFPGFLGFPRFQRRPSDQSISRRSDSFMGSTHSSYGLSNIMNLAYRASPGKNAFIATGESLYAGCTYRNIIKGFLWSLAITSMHYVGIAALRIPQGDFTLEPPLVILSGLISWAVCLVGCILMSQIETHLTQQFLFAAVACTGVAAMHFTGMRAAKFWSNEGPSSKRGYPPALAVAIGSIAITTCIAANFLLAHVATISRNKLAEIVITRKKLWRTIAQKENAEAAAAARSDFIASASHEIRTPLHHLQGTKLPFHPKLVL